MYQTFDYSENENSLSLQLIIDNGYHYFFISSCHPKYRRIPVILDGNQSRGGLLTKKKEFFESQDKEKNLEGSFQKPIRFSDSISIQSGRKYPIVFFSPKMVRSFFVKRYGEYGHMPIETK